MSESESESDVETELRKRMRLTRPDKTEPPKDARSFEERMRDATPPDLQHVDESFQRDVDNYRKINDSEDFWRERMHLPRRKK